MNTAEGPKLLLLKFLKSDSTLMQKMIEERKEKSDKSQNESKASTDCDDTEPVFVCHRKKKKKSNWFD